MRIKFGLFSLFAAMVCAPLLSTYSPAFANSVCGPNALGTARTIKIDAKKYRHIRGKEKALGLRDKEVILTFDDGPIAGKTSRILKALKDECVKATFFYVGRMAKYQPKLVRRVVAEGHTLAHHTHSHNRLTAYSKKRAGQLIDQGISTLQKIAYGQESTVPKVPFFRYPYLSRNKSTDKILAEKGLIAFDANIDSLDWKSGSPNTVHDRIMRLLRKEGRGIILMHDIQSRTAKMLPQLLDTLKSEGFKVVHIAPTGPAAPAEETMVVASIDSKKSTTRAVEVTPKIVLDDVAKIESDGSKTLIAASVLDNRSNAQENRSANKQAVTSSYTASRHLAAITSQLTDRTGVASISSNPTPPPSSQPERAAEKSKPELKKQIRRRIDKSKVKSGSTVKKLRKNRRKGSVIVVAGNSKRNRIKTGSWKLRRSQWILR